MNTFHSFKAPSTAAYNTMLSVEKTVTVPVYQPPKRSLREFLSEQAPQLLRALKQAPECEKKTVAIRKSVAAKPRRPPKYIEQMDYLEGSSLLYTPDKVGL